MEPWRGVKWCDAHRVPTSPVHAGYLLTETLVVPRSWVIALILGRFVYEPRSRLVAVGMISLACVPSVDDRKSMCVLVVACLPAGPAGRIGRLRLIWAVATRSFRGKVSGTRRRLTVPARECRLSGRAETQTSEGGEARHRSGAGHPGQTRPRQIRYSSPERQCFAFG